MDSKESVYPYRIALPADLKDTLLKNLQVPGEAKSFHVFYTQRKTANLGRKTGPGIDKKRGHSVMEPKPQGVDVTDPNSEWFTVEETAFFNLQKWASKVHGELTSTTYDQFFRDLVTNRGAG